MQTVLQVFVLSPSSHGKTGHPDVGCKALQIALGLGKFAVTDLI